MAAASDSPCFELGCVLRCGFRPWGFSVTTETRFPDGSGRIASDHYSPGPFMRYPGPGEVTLLLMPVALTGLAVWLAQRRGALPGRTKMAPWGLGTLRLGYCSIPIWFLEEVESEFIGGLHLPAAVALIISAITLSVTKRTPDGASERQSS